MLKPRDTRVGAEMQRGNVAWPSPIAVVAGLDLNGLGVVRSLAAEGVTTIALDTDLSKSTASTRFGRKIKVSALSGPAFIEALQGVAARLAQKPVLFLTQEGSVETVAAAQAELLTSYRFTMADHRAMKTLLNKADFQETAEELHCAIPRSLRLTRTTDLSEFASLRFPCVVKPLTKNEMYSAKFKKAYKVARFEELDELWRALKDTAGEMIVQEWIEGTDSDVYFCLQYRPRSSLPVSFVGRKICQWPPLVGGTASCVSAPSVRDELIALTDAFFERVGFVGLGSMEYKRDVRDGRFYMVEPTVGRTDYQEEVATLNGVNIPYAAYCGEIGRSFNQYNTDRLPQIWRDSLSYRKALTASAPDAAMQVSPRAKIVDAYFRAHDPLPYLRMKAEPVERRMKRWLGRR
jgi:predicted ATP-grasp superfamily ATP-dependent carboligase